MTDTKMLNVGQPLERSEDLRLLRGRGRYADDLPVSPRTLNAAILRSPHAHAEIEKIDIAQARSMPGVAAVITGEDVSQHCDPFLVALRQPLHQWPLAVGRVRYVGEPVAVVVADDRYLAEDAVDGEELVGHPGDVGVRISQDSADTFSIANGSYSG